MLLMKNNQVACLPFPEEALKKQTGGLATVSKKGVLVPLCVWIGNVNPKSQEDDTGIKLNTDDVVYVKATCAAQQWAKEKLTLYGSTEFDPEFILVPLNEIVCVEKVSKESN
jgi:hypothetical protein